MKVNVAIDDKIQKRQLIWYGHVTRMEKVRRRYQKIYIQKDGVADGENRLGHDTAEAMKQRGPNEEAHCAWKWGVEKRRQL